jgi:chemotaxis protein MotB
MKRMLLNQSKQEAEVEASGFLRLKRYRSSQIIFIALFTSLLALFVIIIAIVGIETSQEKRSYQKVINTLYRDVKTQAQKDGMSWLEVDNTVAKGVKITFKPELFEKNQLFAAARAKINPLYLPYLNQLIQLLKQVNFENYIQEHKFLVGAIPIEKGAELIMTLRVEGHTDAGALAKTALYQSNIELSGFRAYAIMNYIQLYSQIPEDRFGIAGYGSLRPISNNPMDPINRRVEIYLLPQIITKPEGQS